MTPPGAELEVVVVDDRSRRPGSLPPPRRGRRVPHRLHPRLRIAGGARQRGPSDPRRRPRPSGRARRPNLVRRARRRRDRPVPGSERARDRGGPRPGGRPASRQRLPHTGRPPRARSSSWAGATPTSRSADEVAGSHEVHLSIGSRQMPLPQRILGRDLFWFLEAKCRDARADRCPWAHRRPGRSRRLTLAASRRHEDGHLRAACGP